MLGMKARLKTQLIVLAVTVGAVAFVWWAGPTRLWANPLNWTDEENLSDTSMTTKAYPDIKAHGDTVYAVWTEQVTDTVVGYDPLYAKSINGGVSFSPTVNISASMDTDSTNARVAINEEDGQPHFVWAEQDPVVTDTYDIWYSDLTSTVRITRTGGMSTQPDVAVANDKVHVVWAEFFSRVLYASKWVTDTWQNAQVENVLTSAPGVVYRAPATAVGGDGVVHAVWTEDDGVDQIVYYNRRLTPGWQTPTNILSPTGVFDYPAIAVSGTQSVYVIYSYDTSSDPNDRSKQYVGFVKSIDGGQNWLTPTIITGPIGANSSSPRHIASDIAVDDQGIRAVWSGTTGGTDEIVFYGHSTNEGDSWKTIEQVTDSSDNRTTPAMDVEQGTVHLVWARGLPTLRDACYSRSWQSSGGVYLPLILKNY
jgi:hypothetical protein